MESKLTVELCEYLRAQGCLCFAIVGNAMQESGWPDRWIGFEGRSWWLEFKVEKQQLSSIQLIKLTQLRKVGQQAFVVRHVTDKKLQIEWGRKTLCQCRWRDFVSALVSLTRVGNGTH